MNASALRTLGAAVADALASAPAERIVVVHVPVPAVPVESLRAAAGAASWSVFAPPGEPALAGSGCAASVCGDELGQVRARGAGLLALCEERTLGAGAALPTRLLGAVPFEGRGARFVLPRWRLATGDGGAWLSLAALPAERSTTAAREVLAANLLEVLARLGQPLPRSPSPRVVATDTSDELRYAQGVARAVDAIAAGRLTKVVLARRSRVTLASPPDPLAVLAALAEEAGWGARLAQADGERAFVAVSPERLVRRQGREVWTEALAGSAAPGEEVALAASAKNQAEHLCVVEAIAAALAPWCESLDVPRSPGRRALRHVLHLHTPIRGTLARGAHVLELVEALHPTPAVGGAPREAALDFLARTEGSPRGLYAGAHGWFDAAGDGDFWVGLRCGLLDAHVADVWVGAGIVAGSRPEAEVAETRFKQRAFLRALGVRS